MMPKFRKKPVIVEAIHYDGSDASREAILRWGTVERAVHWQPLSDRLSIETLEGLMIVSKGDWVIKGVADECYPCKPDIFEQTYEEAPDDPA